MSLASTSKLPALAQALSSQVRRHSMFPWLESLSGDWVVRAPAHDCHPNHTAPAPSAGVSLLEGYLGDLTSENIKSICPTNNT